MADTLDGAERERIKAEQRTMIRRYLRERLAEMEQEFASRGLVVTRLEMLDYWLQHHVRHITSDARYRAAGALERARIDARTEATIEVITELRAQSRN